MRRIEFLRNAVLVLVVAPHTLGCATITRGTFDVTVDAATVPAEQVRTSCGGTRPCPQLCEDIITEQMSAPYRNYCDETRGEMVTIDGCEVRGQQLRIICEWENDKKGCMPDS